jgi:CubicO group peptidase (beta-lactamase class C family)
MEATAAPEDVGLCSKRLERIGAWMEEQVGAGRVPGLQVALARRGEVVFSACAGAMDEEQAKPMRPDTLFRIYSMTKPVTSVAAMMLYEEGCFQLDDPVGRYLPALAHMGVFTGGDADAFDMEPAHRPITVHDLMTHTSGLTYGFFEESPVDAIYRARGIDFGASGRRLAELVAALGEVPLLCHPGAEWNYGVSTDVLGHLVEVWSGMDLDRFFAERILAPLGMTDTGFVVPEAGLDRFAACYRADEGGGYVLADAPRTSSFAGPTTTPSGGGGLVSSAADYMRFLMMLRGLGEAGGVRLLGRKTVQYMTTNHLPGDLADMGQPTFSETSYAGIGYGLGVSVVLDPAKAGVIGSPGEYAWGGIASTAFWVDPAEDLCVVFMTQLIPSSTHPFRRQLRVLAYQAIVE